MKKKIKPGSKIVLSLLLVSLISGFVAGYKTNNPSITSTSSVIVANVSDTDKQLEKELKQAETEYKASKTEAESVEKVTSQGTDKNGYKGWA